MSAGRARPSTSSQVLTPRRPLAYSPPVSSRRISHFAVVLGLALLTPAALPVHAAAAVPTPTIAGPITSPGGAFVTPTTSRPRASSATSRRSSSSRARRRAYTQRGAARQRRPLDGDARATTRRYKTRIARSADRRRAQVQRHGRRRVAERVRRARRRARLDVRPPLPDARGLRLGRRVGAVRRRRGRRRPARRSTCRSRRSTRCATRRSHIPATASRTTCSRRSAQALRHRAGARCSAALMPRR